MISSKRLAELQAERKLFYKPRARRVFGKPTPEEYARNQERRKQKFKIDGDTKTSRR